MEQSEQQIRLPQELQVNVPLELRAPKYANLVNISASDGEITLNFIYVNPQDNPAGTLVSRVAVPRSMLGTLTDTLETLSEVAGRKDK